jgi:type II secretory ATPase GspE/PulE/Tfp pilus assembly ATPase PilB-like protein
VGGLPQDQLSKALDRFRSTGDSLGRCVQDLGWPDESSALKALAETLSIEFVDLSETEIDRAAASDIPSELIHRVRAIPVSQQNGRLLLAMANPFDFQTVEHIQILTGKEIDRAVCTEADMESAMQTFYGFSVERMIEHLEIPEHDGESDNVQIGHLRELASEPTVINLVNLMIARAIRDRASDIHFEPFNTNVKVKYRIDGVLHLMPSPPKHLQDAIISRIKIMADMNIAERYIPQDGHIELNFEGREVDVRVATIPTIHGECMVMRLLDKSTFLFGLDHLGFEEGTLTGYRNLLDHPHGIVLVCGPTGSGKTTTLYAALTAIFTPERKFITIEDPVEYELEGVNQIPVRPKRGLTFANGLRSIVRQDPDVIMVGEIRDSETAEIAIRSALTGHLVLSSLHTNDAPESIARLLDMGVKPYLIASSVRGILAQRLVRKVCRNCGERFEPSPALVEEIRREIGSDSDDATFYSGKGCSECNGTGYWGRAAILELMIVDEGLRHLILEHSSASAIRKHLGAGMQTMRQAGLIKVCRGVTTPEEVFRATQEDERFVDSQ